MGMKEKIKSYYIDLVKGKRKGVPEALFSFLLLLPSFGYGFFVRLTLSCYETGLLKSYKPDCRTISVGNISWGGTGKTPLVEAIAKFFKEKGKKPAVLIRGYGNDEVYMLRSKLKDIPILAGRDRIKTAKQAQNSHAADVIILDDGFQHWRLERDLDIVLIDAGSPFGNKRFIPGGSLREPLSSLRRADVFVLTRIKQAKEGIEPIRKELHRYNPQAAIYEAIHLPNSLYKLASGEKLELSAIRGRRIGALCAIGSPESFKETLDSLGAEVALKFYFSDHYQYTKEDLQRIAKECLKEQVQTIITTEKDASKLAALLKSARLDLELLVLGVEPKIIKQEEAFYRQLQGEGKYSVLILSDGKAGHLNQSKAVARIIQEIKAGELNVEAVEVKFKNGFCRALLAFCSLFAGPRCRRCLRCLRFCLKRSSFDKLMQSPANIVVSAGSSLASVNLYLGYKNRARKVVLMKPSLLSLNRFDLVIVPEHDRLKPGNNIVVTKIAPNVINQHYLEEQAKALKTIYEKRGPTIGVLIGGDTPKYRISAKFIDALLFELKQVAQELDGQLLVTTSRRTPRPAEKALKEALGGFGRCKLLVIANEKNIPEAVGGILGLSDIVLVSGESISMISESLASGKHVLVLVPLKKTKGVTRQEIFLKNLAKEGFIKIIEADRATLEIEKLWKEKPPVKKIEDRDLIYQGLAKIL